MTDVFRLLRNFLGSLLAAVALLATGIASFIVIAMALVWWQEGRLNEQDMKGLGWASLAAAVGALFTWAGFRLARGRPKPGEARVPAFTLTRSPGGRQERFAEVFASVVYLVLFGGWLWSRVAGEPWARGAQVAGWLALVYLGLHVRVLVHELGHLGAARLLGMDLVHLRVGAGPTLWRGGDRAGLSWEWRLRPSSGYAEALHPGEEGFRRRQFLFVAGGPLADAVQLGLLWTLLPHPAAGALPRVLAAAASLSVANVLLVTLATSATFSLVPHRIYQEGNKLSYSDGWWLCRLPFFPAARIREWIFGQAWVRVDRLWAAGRRPEAHAALADARHRYPEHAATLALVEGRICRLEGEPARAAECFGRVLTEGGRYPLELRPHLWAERAAALAAAGQVEEARAECAAVLAQAAPADRVTFLDAFAGLPILHPGAGELLADAEAWAMEAVALAPGQITLRGTLGSLMIERGREEEGAAILREVLARTESDTDRGIAAFYLGVVAGRRGQRREMEAYRRQASRLCTVPVLRGRMEAELSAA